ncbi:ATP-binding protein [Mycobacterium sp.]|uniref:ATP-binding protein n=1 Tax=Mycobacterium sp. TaxID=1785 RepID=UPI003F7E4E8D
MTAATACRTCGTELREGARFCDGCGSPVKDADTRAEYKQVTVLFADVVHSMDIAAAVGAERLREIMTELVERCAAVVQRYGGTVDKFTGDGIMAVFGAPVALEDHAFRACMAAIDVQEEANWVAAEVQHRDGLDLRLRLGLNSGQVIAGDIGSGSFGYTAVGEQVGMAQRMESVAAPGGVMLSASTARLVDGLAVLGDSELVQIKGADEPVAARRLLGMTDQHRGVGRADSNLVGRRWEMSAVEGLLERAIDGDGAVVGVVGPPGIGKSRLVREVSAMAGRRGVEVFTTFCESHTSGVPFHAVVRLLRAVTGVEGLDGQTARDRVRDRIPDADPEDLLLLNDLLGIADPNAGLPAIGPDARRRRLTALLNAASLARETPVVYVVEDAHWIDEVSESMLAEFLTVIPQTASLVLVTYRPDYRGALTRVADAQTLVLKPLSDSETAALITGLLGVDASVGELGQMIADRAAGNPFFAGEIVRELAERGILSGPRGAYTCLEEVADIDVPATLQATIAARIDRVGGVAKRTLNAAAIIGSRFDDDLLTSVLDEVAVTELVDAELVEQVRIAPVEYAFRHPLVRMVAYESQLKSGRAQLHQTIATAIEQRDPGSVEENAALIASHLEAAGDLRAAFTWHMRAATWLTHRDISAARMNWQRAVVVADRMHVDDPDRLSMQIAPRTLLCATIWRVGGELAEIGFDELRELTMAAGDKRSLAIGMCGLVQMLNLHGEFSEAARLASEYVDLLESIGEPEMTVGLLAVPIVARWDAGEMTEAMRLAERAIDLSGGNPTMGNLIIGSPLGFMLALRASTRCCLNVEGWHEDFDKAINISRDVDPFTHSTVAMIKYVTTLNWALLPDDTAVGEMTEALRIAERTGDDFQLANARFTLGLALVRCDGPARSHGFELLHQVRDAVLQHRYIRIAAVSVDLDDAAEKTRTGDYDGAIDLCRGVLAYQLRSGEGINRGWATTVLVEALLQRGRNGDLEAAQEAIDRLAAMPTEPVFLYHELPLLRLNALIAKARGDEAGYREFRDRYRARAKSVRFEGHMAMAEAMP